MNTELKEIIFYLFLFVMLIIGGWYYIIYTAQTNLCFKEAANTICQKNNMSLDDYSYWNFEARCIKFYKGEHAYSTSTLYFDKINESLCGAK